VSCMQLLKAAAAGCGLASWQVVLQEACVRRRLSSRCMCAHMVGARVGTARGLLLAVTDSIRTLVCAAAS
jgi:hypothetical protein